MKCRPHRWNIEDWLPLFKGNRVEDSDPEIWCLDCGRVLAVRDTTLNMRASIANGIAKRFLGGDEYDEVYESVNEYFEFHLAAFRKGGAVDCARVGQTKRGRAGTGATPVDLHKRSLHESVYITVPTG